MKERFTATTFLLAIGFTACSKDVVPQEDSAILATNNFKIRGSATAVFTSDWESVSQWSSEKTNNGVTFFYSRPTPQLSNAVLQKGVVVVFARNLWAGNPAFQNMGATDKPLKMPFYFLPYLDQPDYTEQWNYSADENKININLHIDGASATQIPNSKLQFRFIVIPKDLIAQKGTAADAVRKMSYNDIVQAFNLK
jgi:hypothetical protein